MKFRLKGMALGLLSVLLAGSMAYASEEFFWSDTPQSPTCWQTRDGSHKEIGLIIGGERVAETVLSCDEAIKIHVNVLVDGKYLQTVAGTGVEPFIENGRTMVPLRALADAFGFEVGWEESTSRITLTKGDKTISFQIGEQTITVETASPNGSAAETATAYFGEAVPVVKNGRTFVPASKLAELLGIRVDWDPVTRTAQFMAE